MHTGSIGSLRFLPGGISGLPLLLGGACLLSPPAPPLGASEAALAPAADPPREPEPVIDEEEAASAPEPPLDTWSLAAQEDGDACRADLKAAGIKFRAFGDRKEPDKSGCGIPHPVVVSRGPTGIAYEPPINVDCTLARALVAVERVVQEEAEKHLGAKIARIGNLGGFACRPRNSRKGASLSAHAFGSAVDVSSFHPAKGTPAIVAHDWSEPKRPSTAQEARRRFLHAVFWRLRREADLTYAVGPDFNARHRDHFHLDRGGWHFWFNR